MNKILQQLTSLYDKELIELEVLEFCRYLSKLDDSNDGVLVTGAAAMHYHLKGHICFTLTDLSSFTDKFDLPGVSGKQLSDALSTSDLIGKGSVLSPLVLENDRIYLHRFWKYEEELVEWILAKSEMTFDIPHGVKQTVEKLFPDSDPEQDRQKTAVLLSHLKELLIITGGPGTGKTFTIQKILESHYEVNKELKVALAAPTGKAAQRLNESLLKSSSESDTDPAVTIHSLLKAKGMSGEFRYNRNNKLPFDLIIIDEASMLDLNLWISLIRAVGESTRLILLGDKNQLASVEAGSILGDICSVDPELFTSETASIINLNHPKESATALNDCIVELKKSYRFDENSGIRKLSEGIIQEDAERVLSVLKSDDFPDVRFKEVSNPAMDALIEEYVLDPFTEMQREGFSHSGFKKYQILCALRKGPYGVEQVSRLAESRLKKKTGISQSDEWYEGRPVMVTRNNYSLKLRNGETGFCRISGQSGINEILFEGREQPVISSRLPDFESAFVITVHKSQGSEYENVALLLSNADNSILTKELLYTSVTRARQSLLIIGNEHIISSCVTRKIERRSGIQNKVWKAGIH